MTPKCPKPLDLVTYFLEGGKEGGTLEGGSAIDAHVRDCASCQAQLQELEIDRKAFLVRHPFSTFWNDLEKKTAVGPSPLMRLWRWIAASGVLRTAVAAAGVAGLVIVAIGRDDRPPQILSKGSGGIQFYVVAPQGGHAPQGGEPELGKSGMTLPGGSSLQFVTTAQEPYLLLVGVEADRTLSVYYPSGGSESAPIQAGDRKKLPQALRWEPQSAYERFYGIFSKEPVKVEEVRKGLEGITIEQSVNLPLPYPHASVILYRK
jgi:hypothetical protein